MKIIIVVVAVAGVQVRATRLTRGLEITSREGCANLHRGALVAVFKCRR